MTSKGYIKDYYRQFEELNKKLDKLIIENKEQSLTIHSLNSRIKELEKTIQEKDKKIELLLKENDKLKNNKNKNSSNSSKPSSTDITKPKKKTGANLYNYRIKSNKKIGAVFGHAGACLSKGRIEKLIEENKLEVRTINHKINGNINDEPIVKYRLGLEFKPYVEKHIFKHTKKSKEKLPKEFYTDVTYDNSIKTLSIELGSYNVISYDRLSDFFNVITNGVLNISNGTLVNFVYEFGHKSESTVKKLEEDILKGKNLKTDETSSKFNGKNMYVRNYSNSDTVVYKAHKNKGHKPIVEDNILPIFCGGIMGDHDTTLYKYGTKNYECNVHVGRYLEELVQNILEISWASKMKSLLFRMNETKKYAQKFGLDNLDNAKIKEYEKEYDEILILAKEENKNIKSTYYKEKANKLYNRLKKYKNNHLYFIKDFEVDFDNNTSEQDLRFFKIKTKISGGFRSMECAKYFVNGLSIIKTSIKRGINPYNAIQRVFNNEEVFA